MVHAWISAYPGRLWRVLEEVGRSWQLCWALSAILFTLAMTPLAGSHGSAALTSFEAVSRNVLYCLIATAFLFPGSSVPRTTVSWCV